MRAISSLSPVLWPSSGLVLEEVCVNECDAYCYHWVCGVFVQMMERYLVTAEIAWLANVASVEAGFKPLVL